LASTAERAVADNGHPGTIQLQDIQVPSKRSTRSVSGLILRILQASLALWAMATFAAPMGAPIAAPTVDLPVNSPLAARSHNPSAVILSTALPAVVASKLKIRTVPLDEPRFATEHFRDLPATPEAVANAGMEVPWQKNKLVALVRNYKRDGLPLVHLYQSDQSSLHLGFNTHGVPGIYYTVHLPD
jgi:hypothetical protein